MPFKSLYKDLLVFIQLLGNSFPSPAIPRGHGDIRTKMATFVNEDTAKAICHWGIKTHKFSNPFFYWESKGTAKHKTLTPNAVVSSDLLFASQIWQKILLYH